MTKMTDLTKRNADQFVWSEPAGSTLSERIKAAVGTARSPGQDRGLPDPSQALVLDISGSMAATLGPNVRAIDELRKVADQFRDVRRFEFHSSTREIQANEKIGDPRGGTNLALALMTVKAKGIKHAVVITDGQPDDEDAALAAAKGMKIDVFYIGPDPAPEFCRDLARETGGEYGKASLHAPKALGQAVRALLPAPGQADQADKADKKPILL